MSIAQRQNIVLNILLSFIAGCATSFGENLIRFSHLKAVTARGETQRLAGNKIFTTSEVKSEEQKHDRSLLFPDKYWVYGLLLIVFVSGGLSLWSFRHGNDSFLFILTGTRLISNNILAKYLNKESVRFQHLFLSLVIGTGTFLTSRTTDIGSMRESKTNLYTLLLKFINTEFIIFIFVIGTIVSCLWSYTRAKYEERLITDALSLAVLSGIFTSFTQSFVRILVKTTTNVNYGESEHMQTQVNGWVLIIMLFAAVFGILHLLVMNEGLRKYPAYLVGPVLSASISTAGMFFSLLFFKQQFNLSQKDGFEILTGLFMTTFGVAALAKVSKSVLETKADDNIIATKSVENGESTSQKETSENYFAEMEVNPSSLSG